MTKNSPRTLEQLVFILLTMWIGVACTASSGTVPKGLQPLDPSNDDELEQRFPGYQGKLFEPDVQGSTPLFGIIHSKAQCDTVLLTGFTPSQAWTFEVPVEREGVRINSLEVHSLHIGNLTPGSDPELLVHISVTSRDPKQGTTQEREALYLFNLGDRVEILWYATLRLDARREQTCAKGQVRYEAKIDYQFDEDWLVGISVQGDIVGKRCTGGDSCDGQQDCRGARQQRRVEYQWDSRIDTFHTGNDTSAVLMIPDVSYSFASASD